MIELLSNVIRLNKLNAFGDPSIILISIILISIILISIILISIILISIILNIFDSNFII